MNFEEDFEKISVDKCFFITAKKRHTRLDELMFRKGLSHAQPRLLFELHRTNGCTQKELADMLIIRPASVTSALQRLEQLGYVERVADKNDLRMMRVYLTSEGMDFLEECKKTFEQLEEECFRGFTEEELTELRRLLTKMYKNLN